MVFGDVGHYVSQGKKGGLGASNILFDNFNTYIWSEI